ncbi:MAG: hypothetical protein QF848_04480 [Planctomycetota bacterium]|jgi:hypothetical protein|nr:hypothetical protein [Planctomycetota bacterium]
MKRPTLLLLTVLFAPTGEEHDLVLEHRTRQVRLTAWKTQFSKELKAQTNRVGDKEVPGAWQGSIRFAVSGRGIFLEGTQKMEDAERQVFDRRYTALEFKAATWTLDGETVNREDCTGDSELNDLTVRFTRGEDGFVAGFPKEENADDELLDGLQTEFPWTAYLPDGPVEVGDEWDIDAQALEAALDLGLDLPVEFDSDDGDKVWLRSRQQGHADIQGEVKATLKKIEEVDGHSLAAIALEVELEILEDATDRHREQLVLPDTGSQRSELNSCESKRVMEGGGLLVWDLTDNCPGRLLLQLTATETETIQITEYDDGQEQELEVIRSYACKRRHDLLIEAKEPGD